MITKEDFRTNFAILSVHSRLGFLPIDVNIEEGRLGFTQSWWKRWSSFAWFCGGILHALYITTRLLQTLVMEEKYFPPHVVYHLAFVIGSCSACVWYQLMFLRCPDITVGIWNEMFQRTGGPRGLHKRSRQEHIAILAPFALNLSVLAVGLVNYLNSDMKLLLVTSWPEAQTTPLVFTLCLTSEVSLTTFYTVLLAFVYQTHVLFFEMTSGELRNIQEAAVTNSGKKSKTVARLRVIQLLVILFNELSRHVTYNIKIMCLSVGTMCGYAAIAYVDSDLPFLVLYCAIFMDVAGAYPLVYEKAFVIPDEFARAKSALKRSLRGSTNLPQEFLSSSTGIGWKSTRRRLQGYIAWKRVVAMLDRKVNSIPAVGIRLGNFHNFERASTPIFLDYVVRNIVNLLVTTRTK